jgi:hypothetical protein
MDHEVFQISEKDWERIRAWQQEIDAKVKEQQKGTSDEHRDMAYYGAIGGAYTYSFTPTGMGTVVKVTNVLTGDVLDITDYEDW